MTHKNSNNRFQFECHRCGLKDHKQADCRRKLNQANYKPKGNSAHVASEEKKQCYEDNDGFCFSTDIQAEHNVRTK